MSHLGRLSMRFHNLALSDHLVEIIEDEAHRLQRRHPQIQSCAVVLERRNHRHCKGNPVWARVTVELPGRVVVSAKHHDEPDDTVSASAALARAFRAAEHAVASYLDRQHTPRHGYHHAHLDPALVSG